MKRFLHFIRFSHTIFAMPFAIGSYLVASNGHFSWRIFGLVVLAMVSARSAAMTFNRLADWEIDKRNPRTEARHRLVSRREAVILLVLSSALFVAVSWFINFLCFLLSPFVLGLLFFYSFTKRFTSGAQFFLGLALSLAPVGAWLAVSGELAFAPLVLALAVVFWVSGFDIIYATQDYEIDRREGLKSMVVRLGIPGALRLARALHLLSWIALGWFGLEARLGIVYFAGILLVAPVLIWEHLVASRRDLNQINQAFFVANAVVGILFVSATLINSLIAAPLRF